MARRISAQRIFEKRYHQSYDWFIQREHINRPAEILRELSAYFDVAHRAFFPLKAPWVWCNLCVGLTLKPKRVATVLPFPGLAEAREKRISAS
jgi:hypothetical protein